MLKKLLAAVLFCCTLLIPLGGNAFTYPKYLNGDTNYELAFGNHMIGQYVDKSSVTCLVYNPPYYKLAANVIDYDYRYNKLDSYTTTHYYEYYYDKHEVYEITDNGDRRGPFFDSSNNNNTQIRPIKTAKIIWKTAYNMNW